MDQAVAITVQLADDTPRTVSKRCGVSQELTKCENGAMPEHRVTAGFPDMWQPVYEKYRQFFECAHQLAPIVSDMIKTPVRGTS